MKKLDSLFEVVLKRLPLIVKAWVRVQLGSPSLGIRNSFIQEICTTGIAKTLSSIITAEITKYS
ncbi:hypothetical protein RUND412_011288 [Rhizina undulata]